MNWRAPIAPFLGGAIGFSLGGLFVKRAKRKNT